MYENEVMDLSDLGGAGVISMESQSLNIEFLGFLFLISRSFLHLSQFYLKTKKPIQFRFLRQSNLLAEKKSSRDLGTF